MQDELEGFVQEVRDLRKSFKGLIIEVSVRAKHCRVFGQFEESLVSVTSVHLRNQRGVD